jgi:ribonuclease R
VLLSSLTDDYYIHDWRKHRLIGDISGRIIQIGDLVEVVAIEVEADRGRIFFTLEGNSAKEISSETKHHK